MEMTHYYTTMESPLGALVLTSDGEALTGLFTPKNSHYAAANNGIADPAPFVDAVRQLREYFAGERAEFDLKLAMNGTEFQKRVWDKLCDIGFGETASYGEIASKLDMPSASRAVGAANGQNPICIIVPCHRVIASNGKLTGYNGGLETKEWLLRHEANLAGRKLAA